MRRDPREAGRVIRPQCISDSSERKGRRKGGLVEASSTAVQFQGKFRKAAGLKVFVRGRLHSEGIPAALIGEQPVGRWPRHRCSKGLQSSSWAHQLSMLSEARDLGGQPTLPSHRVTNPGSHKEYQEVYININNNK